MGSEFLEGEWRTALPPPFVYEIVERNHEMRGEYWGGFSRHNDLYRRILDSEGNLLKEEFLLSNSAIMMYAPFLAEPGGHDGYIK